MLTDAELDTLILQAQEAANRAWETIAANTSDCGPAGFAWMEIPIDNMHFDLTGRLARASIGRRVDGLDGLPMFHRVISDHLIQAPLNWSIELQIAAFKAFARVLNEAGFSPAIKKLVA